MKHSKECQSRFWNLWYENGLPRPFAGKKYAIACEAIGQGNIASSCCKWDARARAVILWKRKSEPGYLLCKVCDGDIYDTVAKWYSKELLDRVYGGRLASICENCRRRMFISLCRRMSWARDEGLIERWEVIYRVAESDHWLAQYITDLASIATLATMVGQAASRGRYVDHPTSRICQLRKCQLLLILR